MPGKDLLENENFNNILNLKIIMQKYKQILKKLKNL